MGYEYFLVVLMTFVTQVESTSKSNGVEWFPTEHLS